MGEVYLDLRGLNCPLPVLKTRKALQSVSAGGLIRAATTDPLASIDMPNFCRENGHRLLSVVHGDGFQEFVIEKGEN